MSNWLKGILALWALAVLLAGSVLTSFHQPFQTTAVDILALTKQSDRPGWRAVHLLSGSCGCSQKVMRHMLQRGRFEGVAEEVVLLDEGQPYLPESQSLLDKLALSGFAITHIATNGLPAGMELHGVPLLAFVDPQGKQAYLGGYGAASDQDRVVLDKLRSGVTVKALAVIGCAVGSRLKSKVDPFHLKY